MASSRRHGPHQVANTTTQVASTSAPAGARGTPATVGRPWSFARGPGAVAGAAGPGERQAPIAMARPRTRATEHGRRAASMRRLLLSTAGPGFARTVAADPCGPSPRTGMVQGGRREEAVM